MSHEKTFHHIQAQYNKLIAVKGYITGHGKMYTSAVATFFTYLKTRGYAEFNVTSEDMIDYYTHLSTRPNQRQTGLLSQTTINHHLFAISLLFDFLIKNKTFEALPLIPKYIRNQTEPQSVLSIEEIKQLYQATKNKLETALLSVAYGCGLRRSEISKLHLTDINLKQGYIIIRSGKHQKRREVPMSDKVIHDLQDYIYNERIHSKPHRIYHLIITRQGNAMSGYYMNETVKNIAKRVPSLEGKKITLHTLRRSIATHLAEKGASIHFIKSFLGHSQIDTSQLYVIRRKRKHKLSS